MRPNLKWIILVFWATGGPGGAFAGGVQFLVSLDTNDFSSTTDLNSMLGQTSEALRKRLDKIGVGQAILEPQGSHTLLVALANVTGRDLDLVRQLMTKRGLLEFRMVHPESAELVRDGIIEPGYELLKEERKLPDGRTEAFSYLVNKKPATDHTGTNYMTGKHLKRAFVNRNQMTGEPEIDFELDDEGARIFGEITTEWAPKGNKFYLLAIVLDGELESAPRINGPITGSRGVISGRFDLKQAFNLTTVLESPLPAPLRVLEERSPLDPRLAQEFARRRTRFAITVMGISLAGLVLVVVLVYALSMLSARRRKARSTAVAGPPPLPPSLRT